MSRMIVLLLCLFAGCSRGGSSEQGSGATREPLVEPSTQPPRDDGVVRERNNVQCAALAAEYESTRNSLLGGDRTSLRARLTEIGDAYREKMKAIPDCSFPVL